VTTASSLPRCVPYFTEGCEAGADAGAGLDDGNVGADDDVDDGLGTEPATLVVELLRMFSNVAVRHIALK
jgi:hypothetical protein